MSTIGLDILDSLDGITMRSSCKFYLEILSSLLKPFSKFSDHEVESEQCHSYLCCNYHICVDSNVAVQSHDVKFVIHKASCKLQRKVLPKVLSISSLIYRSSKQRITTLLRMKPVLYLLFR